MSALRDARVPARRERGLPSPPALCPEGGEGDDTKQALLILVHGSPRPSANAEMFRVADAIRRLATFDIVEVGFLECNEPRIPEAIDRCVESGAGQVVAVPYFLHIGTHVADDLPALLAEGALRHPGVEFFLGDYIGRSECLTDILAARARAALTRVNRAS